MTLVSTVQVGSGGAASIEFTNIPQTGKDLLVLVSSRINFAVATNPLTVIFNGTSNLTNFRTLRGSGSAASSSTGTNSSLQAGDSPGSNATSNTFSNAQIYVTNYTTSSNKPISIDSVTENNATAAEQRLIASIWSNSAAVTSVKVEDISQIDFVQNTTVSLYIIS